MTSTTQVPIGSRWELNTMDGKAIVSVIGHGPQQRRYTARGRRVAFRVESGPEIRSSIWEVDLLTSPNARRLTP